MITVRLDHVWMNQPVVVRPQSVLMQERYLLGDLASCGLDGSARTLVVTVDPKDPVLGSVKPENARPGGLDGGPEHGSVETKVEADGSVMLEVKFPYPMLRHVKDPNLRVKPGAFFEPQYFHVEVEMVAKGAGAK